jgi:hypothetical protein
MQYHVVLVDVNVADLQSVTFMAENLKARGRIQPFCRSLFMADGKNDLLQARLRSGLL